MTDPLAEFRAASKRGGQPCGVTVVRGALSPAQRKALDAALTDRSISAPAIVKVVGDWGHPLKRYAVENHRRGDCACRRV